jgi:hypothetical protein
MDKKFIGRVKLKRKINPTKKKKNKGPNNNTK